MVPFTWNGPTMGMSIETESTLVVGNDGEGLEWGVWLLMGTQFVLVGDENVLKLTVVMVAKLKKS